MSGIVATYVEAFCSLEGDEANLLVCAMPCHSVPPSISASLFVENVVPRLLHDRRCIFFIPARDALSILLSLLRHTYVIMRKAIASKCSEGATSPLFLGMQLLGASRSSWPLLFIMPDVMSSSPQLVRLCLDGR